MSPTMLITSININSVFLNQKALDAVEKDLKTVTGVLKTDSRLADFLNDPSVKKPVGY